MLTFSEWPLSTTIIVFFISASIIAIFGTKLTRVVDKLADITGLGEAIAGAIFLGASTSLSGITTSVTTAAEGFAELSISNAIGGIAAQTVFLAIADMAHRKINLEHAAASATNIMQGVLLIILLTLPVLTLLVAEVQVKGVHPISLILILSYIAGIRLIRTAELTPMWLPKRTKETIPDKPLYNKEGRSQLILTWARFCIYGLIIAFAGYVVAQSAIGISQKTAVSQTIIGGVFTAIATSLPELVTSVAAVRQGALTLAVSGVIGGNCFDVLFLAFSDFAFREGSIYTEITQQQLFIIVLTILLTAILLLGMLRREKHGIANIGFESFLIFVLYIASFAFLFYQS